MILGELAGHSLAAVLLKSSNATLAAASKPFQARPDQDPRRESKQPKYHCADFYSYSRRKSDHFDVGPIMIGGQQLVRAFLKVPETMTADGLLAAFEGQLKKAMGADPEIVGA